jgi:hypothetical protein
MGLQVSINCKLLPDLQYLNFASLISLLVIVMEIRDVYCEILFPTKSSLAEICTWNNKRLFRITKGYLFANSRNHCMA